MDVTGLSGSQLVKALVCQAMPKISGDFFFGRSCHILSYLLDTGEKRII